MSLINKFFLSNYVGGVLRHLLSLLGGYLVAKGIADAEQAQSLAKAVADIVPGLLTFGLSLLGSALNKKKS